MKEYGEDLRCGTGKLKYGKGRLPGGMVPGLGVPNIGKRSWHDMERVPWERCTLVVEDSVT